jgi:hypothetical protein
MTLTAKNNLESTALLSQILFRIRELSAQKLRSLVVFDLDSTLFDVSPRLQKILMDFAHHPEFSELYPESVELMKKIQTHRTDWGIKKALLRVGLENHSSEFHESVKSFWIENFFSNHYVHYDVPYEGAPEFVQKVYTCGADVVYLSGRDRSGMEKGTIEVLRRYQFPIDGAQARVELKPQKGTDDAEFKKDWFLSLPDATYEQIWFFENEPLNVNLIREHFRHIDIIFFDSTHAGKAEPPADLPRILHFLLEKK